MLPYYSSLTQNVTQAPSVTSPDTSTIKPNKPRLRRNYLNSAGQSILDEYWQKHPDVMPPLDVRNTLVLQIKNCGNDFYALNNITSWFKRHVALPSTNQILSANYKYPSLSKSAMDHLEVLLTSTTNPSPDVIKTWATLLGAELKDVVSWLQDWHHFRSGKQSPIARLPTPANTVTPEPSLPPSSPRFDESQDANASIKQSPIASPISLSPNILSSTYPSVSRVPGHGQATQMTPVTSPTQVNNNSLTQHRQRSLSSDVSSAPVASPTSPTLRTPPSYPDYRYMPFQQWPPPSSANSSPQSTSISMVPSPSHPNNAPTPPSQIRAPISHPSPAVHPSSSPARVFPPEDIKPQQGDNRPKPRNPILQAIIEGFAEAPGNPPQPPAVVPTSSAEYEAMFASYEKQLNHMRQVLEK